jgi:hypothetical protein
MSHAKYEGGEREPIPTPNGLQRGDSEVNQSEISIDTNLFTDERKEILEIPRTFNKFIGFLIVFGLNLGIFSAVLDSFVKEGYYNLNNSYVWVFSFFGSQIVGLLITNPLCLLITTLITSKWLRFKKVFLARFFRESLYIYEDYQFAVQFANTKIS